MVERLEQQNTKNKQNKIMSAIHTSLIFYYHTCLTIIQLNLKSKTTY